MVLSVWLLSPKAQFLNVHLVCILINGSSARLYLRLVTAPGFISLMNRHREDRRTEMYDVIAPINLKAACLVGRAVTKSDLSLWPTTNGSPGS